MNILAIGSSGFLNWIDKLNNEEQLVKAQAGHHDKIPALMANGDYNCVMVEFRGHNRLEIKTLNSLKRLRGDFVIVGVMRNEIIGLRFQALGEGADICLCRHGSMADFIETLVSIVPFMIRKKDSETNRQISETNLDSAEPPHLGRRLH